VPNKTIREYLVRWASCSIPLELWHQLTRVELIVPHWHAVADNTLPHISGLYRFRNRRQFGDDLEFLLKYYIPVTEDDVIAHLRGHGTLPPRAVLFTFDDGFREVHDVIAPILQKMGLPAIFFLTTAAVDNRYLCYPQKKSLLITALSRHHSGNVLAAIDRLLTEATVSPAGDLPARLRSVTYHQRQVLDAVAPLLDCDFDSYLIRERPYLTSPEVASLLRQGYAVGGHSVDHPPYAELTLSEQLNQTRQSMNWLSERFLFECKSFAFPYRDVGVPREFFQAMFAEGQLGVSFGTGGVGPHFCPFNLPRFSTERTDLTVRQVLGEEFGRATWRRFRRNFAAQLSRVSPS